jgi:2-hydroxy-6-oxonona-2,4-dienedioate hydrolase
MTESPYLPNLPKRITRLEHLAELDRLSERFSLPLGAGEQVWRRWGEGEPVVLLHGGSGSWNHWARNIQALVTAGREVWIPDLPGFGESAGPEVGQDADALPQPIEQALNHLLGDQAFDLIGFSFGSMVAGFVAQNMPERVRKLVLVGSPALGINARRPFALKPWLDVPAGPQRDIIHRHNLGVLMFSGHAAVEDLAVTIHAMNLARDRMHKRRLAYSDVLRRTIAAIDTPLYAVWGADDVLYRGYHAALAEALAQARHLRSFRMIERAGHWVQFEAAQAFNEAILDALQDQP